ncbi:MAG: hydroxyacylglutathione hydrolase [Betaproteobacteria bacterium]|nr:hydroxyacylglutathione hydrolase [Betaproteobacteria bacterium]
MVSITIIPALNVLDNYIYLAAANNRAALIDPGAAAPALAAIQQSGAVLESILITHRHADHIGGVGEIAARYPRATIRAPQNCNLAGAEIIGGGDSFSLLDGALPLEVIAAPGHTLEHVAYFGGGVLFSGDALLACGCGRVFEGTMDAMRRSLAALAALPEKTKGYCGHEYTAANIAFAIAADSDNLELQKRQRETAILRGKSLPTVPFTIAGEKATNPFLRLGEPAIISAAEKHAGVALKNDDAVFTALRKWKDSF